MPAGGREREYQEHQGCLRQVIAEGRPFLPMAAKVEGENTDAREVDQSVEEPVDTYDPVGLLLSHFFPA